MAFLPCQKVGQEICDILGLDGKKVRKIVLTFESNSIVMGDASFYVETEEYDKITPVLKRYKMVPFVEEVDATPLGSAGGGVEGSGNIGFNELIGNYGIIPGSGEKA